MPSSHSVLFFLPLLAAAATAACASDETGIPGAGALAGAAATAANAGRSAGGYGGMPKGSSGGLSGKGTGRAGGSSTAGSAGANAGSSAGGGRAAANDGGSTAANDGGSGGDGGRAGKGAGGVSPGGGAVFNGGSDDGGQAGATRGGEAGGAGEARAGQASAGGEGGGGDEREFAYVATYLGGVRELSLAPETGAPTELEGSPVNDGAHLYNLAVDSARRRLYTVDLDAKHIDFYAIGADGALPSAPTSTTVDFQPLFVALDPRGRFAYVGGFDDASVHVFAIEQDTGALHAAGDPLVLASTPAHVTPDPGGRFIYVSQSGEGGVRAYAVRATGVLTELDHSPFGATLVHSGSMVLEPDGGFLFSSGGGLSTFAVDTLTGELTAVEGSPFSLDVGSDFFASDLALDPQGKFLFATSAFLTGHVSTFAIASSGALDEVLDSPLTVAGFPYSIAVSPQGRRVYVGTDDGGVAVFSLALPGGALSEIEHSPFATGGLQPELAFALASSP